MARQIKTIEYTSYQFGAGIGQSTEFSADYYIPVVLPENNIVFKNVTLESDSYTGNTAGQNFGACGAGVVFTSTSASASVTNSNSIVHSGEDMVVTLAYDLTQFFIDNWPSGSSETLSFSQNSPTTQISGYVRIYITYEYDDDSPTQVKTVYVPLDAPTGAQNTAFTEYYGTVPALDTYLPEANKIYSQLFIVLQGNEHRGTSTSNRYTRTQTGTSFETNVGPLFNGSLATNRFYRRSIIGQLATNPNYKIDTSVESTWSLACSPDSGFNHPQAWLVVTYQYDEAATTRVMNSLLLPMDVDSPMGGPTAADYQRAVRDLWIQEPGTITTERVAFYAFWSALDNASNLNMRVGTGAFKQYVDNLSLVAGSNAAMVRNDTAFSLARGQNSLNFDCWVSNLTAQACWGLSGFWIVNYTSDKSSFGSGAHNHTVRSNIMTRGTGSAENNRTELGKSNIPNTNYFINSLGLGLLFYTSGTSTPVGYNMQVERLPAEGGQKWELVYNELQQADREVGLYFSYSQMRTLFKMWAQDSRDGRMLVTTDRRWRYYAPLNASTGGAGWPSLTLFTTYHTIRYVVSGTVSDVSGTVTLSLWSTVHGKLSETTRVGPGPYSFEWYDDTIPVYVVAKTSTITLKSKTGLPATDFNIAASAGAVSEYYSYG